eukprot:g5093.t1
MAYFPGSLVDISGLPGKATPVPSAAVLGVQAVDLNGDSAQLLHFDKGLQKWIAATFSGRTIAIDGQHVKPVTSEAVANYDARLGGQLVGDFVLGPKSDYDLSGQEITAALATKGYALVKLIDKFPPADIDDGDAEGFMHLMYRRKLTVLQFVGPSDGALKLLPLKEGDEELELRAEPHTMLLMLNSRWEYSYTPSLEDEIQGNIEHLTGQSTGPPAPPGEQVTIEAMYCRYGMQADGRFQFWQGAAKASTDGLTEIPVSRWDHGPYFDPESSFGGSYTRHGCFGIEGVDLFDCKFFEISPMEAKGMDPCQRQAGAAWAIDTVTR